MTVVSDSSFEMVTEIYLSVDLMTISGDKINLYALDSKTIGLSNNPPERWENECLWKHEADVILEDKEYTIIFPKQVVRFYQPKKVEIAGSVDKDNILLIIH